MFLPHFGTSASHLNGICYMLVVQTFMWVSSGFSKGFFTVSSGFFKGFI